MLINLLVPVGSAIWISSRNVTWKQGTVCLENEGLIEMERFGAFLKRLGCKNFYLDRSKRKVVDCVTGSCIVWHKPHPDTTCSPYQINITVNTS